MSKILIIDDERAVLEMIQRALEKEGHVIQVASDPAKGLNAISSFCPEVVD